MSLVNWIDLKSLGDNRGYLSVLEAQKDIPFEIKRIYYLTSLSSSFPRGFHAHKELEQLAICLSGTCKVFLDNGTEKQWVSLSSPHIGLRIEPMVWHEMHDFSEDCVFLVLASDYYDETDYIRNYESFNEMVNR